MRFILRNTVILAVILIFSRTAFASPTERKSRSLEPEIPQYQAQLTETSPELDFFLKAIRQYFLQKSYQVESEFGISVSYSEGSLNYSIQTQMIFAAPHKFRLEIAFKDAESKIFKKYLFISDGAQIWIYNPKKNLYSIMDYNDFKSYNSRFYLGLFSPIFLGTRYKSKNIDTLLNLPKEQLIEALELEFETKITEIDYRTVSFKGSEYKAYKYTNSPNTFSIEVFFNSITANVKFIRLTNDSGIIDFLAQESITSIEPLTFISEDTFRFIPPPNSFELNKPIEIEPF